jgi:hypothetical protein
MEKRVLASSIIIIIIIINVLPSDVVARETDERNGERRPAAMG